MKSDACSIWTVICLFPCTCVLRTSILLLRKISVHKCFFQRMSFIGIPKWPIFRNMLGDKVCIVRCSGRHLCVFPTLALATGYLTLSAPVYFLGYKKKKINIAWLYDTNSPTFSVSFVKDIRYRVCFFFYVEIFIVATNIENKVTDPLSVVL